MKQPEALRLASALNSESESVSAGVKYSTARQSAKELVRLHEANQAMLDVLELIANTGMDARQCHYYARSAIAKGEAK